jgi:hypothetical protein
MFQHYDAIKCVPVPKPTDGLLDHREWEALWEKRNFTQDMTDEEKWELMYKSMFPVEKTPSPCECSQNHLKEFHLFS